MRYQIEERKAQALKPMGRKLSVLAASLGSEGPGESPPDQQKGHSLLVEENPVHWTNLIS